MESQIAGEIIDEIIETCVTMAEAYENENFIILNNEKLSGSGLESDDRSDTENEEIVKQDDYVESNFDEEMDLFGQFEALDCEPSDKSIDSDVRTTEDDKLIEVDIAKSERGNDMVPQCPNGSFKLDEVPQFSHSDPLRLKGFSTKYYGRMIIVINLPLMANSNKFNEYEVQCEGFPPKMTENELIPLFEQFGQVYKLVKNTDRNLMYVTFISAEDGEKAIEFFNRNKVEGRTVKIFKNLPNKRLLVRYIPKSLTKKELLWMFKSISYDLLLVQIYNDPVNENLNRGFCYLEYPSHHHASRAKKELSSKQLFGKPVVVEWPNRRYAWQETPDTLYICNLRNNIRPTDLKQMFGAYGKLIDVKQFGNFASIQFRNVEDAIRAAREIDKSRLGNENVDISNNKLITHTETKNELTLSDTLYINNLSPALTTRDIRSMFCHYGNILETDINGDFASIRFQNPEQSKRALRNIDRKRLGNDVKITFSKPSGNSFDQDCHKKSSDTLYLVNLRPNLTLPDLRKYFSTYGDVMEIDKNNNTASIRFWNPENARQAAHATDKHRLGENVQISFVVQVEHTKQIKRTESSNTLYIYNMYADMTARRLRQLFSVYGDVNNIEIKDGYAAVQFRSSDDARQAAHAINRIHLGRPNPEILSFPKTR